MPDTKTIGVVVGDSAIERSYVSVLKQEFQTFADRVHFEWFNKLTFSEMLKRGAAMPQQSAILWFLLSEDAAGVPYSQDRSLETMREVANVPIFGIGDYELGRGIVGGRLMPTQTMGRNGAEIGLRILQGEAPGKISPAIVSFGAPAYDWRELQKWSISEALLPAGSTVLYRQPNIWEQYRWAIVAAAATILLQSLLITSVLLQSRKRRAAEAEAALQRQEVAHLMRVSVVGELSGAIAHEINQPLSAIQFNAESGLDIMAESAPDVDEIRDVFKDIAEDNRRATEVIRRLRNLLKKGEKRSEPIDVNDLVDSTLGLLNSELIGRRIAVRRDLASGFPAAVGDPVQLQQVLLNLVMNAMDAMASTPTAQRAITVGTQVHQGREIQILVEDSGTGIRAAEQGRLFEPFFTTKAHGLGLGLTLCSTIVEAHGGSLKLANGQAGGAVATISLPVLETLAAAR
jgi:signal transduction histidine kinase